MFGGITDFVKSVGSAVNWSTVPITNKIRQVSVYWYGYGVFIAFRPKYWTATPHQCHKAYQLDERDSFNKNGRCKNSWNGVMNSYFKICEGYSDLGRTPPTPWKLLAWYFIALFFILLFYYRIYKKWEGKLSTKIGSGS